MTTLLSALLQDESGFIVSAELILIATILVIGLVVGLAEVQTNIVNELEDVGSAVGQLQQSYSFSGTYGHKGYFSGSSFNDEFDFCDGQFDVEVNCDGPTSEGGGY